MERLCLGRRDIKREDVMGVCSKHHRELDENGEGKCSVPMWSRCYM
jgi:hypothetical protein